MSTGYLHFESRNQAGQDNAFVVLSSALVIPIKTAVTDLVNFTAKGLASMLECNNAPFKDALIARQSGCVKVEQVSLPVAVDLPKCRADVTFSIADLDEFEQLQQQSNVPLGIAKRPLRRIPLAD